MESIISYGWAPCECIDVMILWYEFANCDVLIVEKVGIKYYKIKVFIEIVTSNVHTPFMNSSWLVQE